MSSNSEPKSRRSVVRTRISPPRVLTPPPGRSIDEDRTSAATSSKVRSYSRSFSCETSIEISGRRTDVSSASVISSSSMRSSRTFSPSPRNIRSETSPCRISEMT